MDNIPPKVQNQIAQFQQLTQQIQMVTTQKIQLEAQVRELDRTIVELEKITDDSAAFKNVGSLLIQVKDRPALVTELKEQKETAEVRVKTIDRQDKHLRERHKSLQDQITQALQAPAPAKPAPEVDES
ncbi:MAG: prefoldin subunit beta [Candidatus Thermoplasmatota archaeon]|nr:prefoldin subunit beta [Candidatus Thermoplasmatota archaeon]MBU1915394.1 prefoldin subunit beta [Candidatus Thermoplasmatota archaeon]